MIGKSSDAHLSRLKNYIEWFFYGKLYPVILALTAFLFWMADLQLVGFFIVVLFGSFALFFFDDILLTIPALFTIPMTFRDSSVFNYSLTPYILLIPGLIAFIGHLLKFQRSKLKFDSLSFGIMGIMVAMLIGGIGVGFNENYKYGLSFVMIAGVAMLAVHFFYTNRTKLQDKYDSKNYLCFSMVTVGNLACFQLIYALVQVIYLGSTDFQFPYFCWANTNNIGYIILIATPMCCYLILNAKNIIPYVVNVVFYYVCVFVTGSDGSICILLGFAPLLLYSVYLNISRKNYQLLKTLYLIVISGATLIVVYLFLFMPNVVNEFFNRATNDNLRGPLYSYAWELFTSNPIFGVGVGHGIMNTQEIHAGYFHSTFFFSIASTGIVGLIAFVVLYILRIKLITKGNTTLGLFTLMSFSMFALYSLIDVGEFHVVLLYITVIMSVTGVMNKKGNGDEPLPINKQFSFYPLRSNVDFV